jgi:hypothetical protein
MTLRVAAVFLVTLMTGCANPTPTPSPTLSPTPTPSAEPSPSPEPALRVDGLATVVRDGLELWTDPTDQNGRQPERSDYLEMAVGTDVLLVDGPQVVDGVDYWQVYPSTRDYTTPLGWAAAENAEGMLNLAPSEPRCPSVESLTAAQLGAIDRLEQLSCFGSQELTLRGQITCYHGIADGILAGPMLNSHIWCLIDDALGLSGPVITALHATGDAPVFRGAFEIRGHFDDPGAQHCYGTPFGTSLEGSRDPGDPGAIQQCRTFFVVTAAEELTT